MLLCRIYGDLAILVLIVCLLGCGTDGTSSQGAHSLTLAEALVQLDQLKAPEGMAEGEFESLRQSLREQLSASGIQRWTAAAPVDAKNSVADLSLSRIDDFSATATWSYLNVGDYDQNREVNISDLTPLASHIGKTPASPGWDRAQIADGDGNNEVNISDLTPLASHLQNSVDGYMIQSTTTPLVESSWMPVGLAPFEDSTQAAPGARRTFSATVPAVSGQSFRVLPYFGMVNGVPGVPFAYTGQAGGGLSFEERQAILNQIAEKMENLVGTTSDEQDAEIAAFIETLPHIEEAGFVEGNAWGRFDDELEITVSKNRTPAGGQQVQSLSQRWFSANPEPNARTTSSGLPSDLGGWLMWGWGEGTLFQDPTEDLSTILNTAGYGDWNTPISLYLLQSIDNDGYLYIDSPAAFGVGRTGMPTYWISTGERVNATNENLFEDDIVTRRLGYMYALNADGTWSWNYSFGAKFVKTYWNFSQNSIVFLNTSRSAGAVDMVSELHQADASVVLGWADNVSDEVHYNAALHLVDRLLGANKYSRTEFPPTRPFNLTSVLFDMQARGVSAGSPIYYPPDPQQPYSLLMPLYNMQDPLNGFSLFIPIIEHMQVNISEDGLGNVLEIYGDFGDTAGVLPSVDIEGEVLPFIGMPDSNTLVCTLPDSGIASFGDTYVRINGVDSLPRKLTAWRGQLTYTESGPGSLNRTIVYNLHFRADISGYRTEPTTDPLVNEGNGIVGIFGAPDGFATVSCSGSYTDPTDTVTTYSNAAITHMDQAYGINYANGNFTNSGSINLATGEIIFVMPSMAPYHEKRVNSEGFTEFDEDTFFYSDIMTLVNPGTGFFQLDLTDYNILNGQVEKQIGETLVSASWTVFPASSPPDANAPR